MRSITYSICLSGSLLLLSGGCAGNSITPFPPGLDPLEADTAPEPPAKNGDPHPEALGVARGSTGSYDWVHARGYLHVPLKQAWAVLTDPTVTADPKVTDRTFELLHDPGTDVSYVFHYTVHDFLTVQFDVTYRFGVVAGTIDRPMRGAGRYQKTSGTDYITLLAGSIGASVVDDHTTAIELIEHLDATASDASEIERYLRAYFAAAVSKVHQPPPL
jgi:hypothetical protein